MMMKSVACHRCCLFKEAVIANAPPPMKRMKLSPTSGPIAYRPLFGTCIHSFVNLSTAIGFVLQSIDFVWSSPMRSDSRHRGSDAINVL